MKDKKYKRAVVFSGGGTRFAIYCGMYAAMQDLEITPDLIIGSCGGSIATSILNSFSTNKAQKEYLKSEELYNFICNTQLTSERKLHRIGWYCLKKIFNKQSAPYIENIFNRYLVDMPADVSKHLPSLSSKMGQNIRSVIIGSQILFNKKEVNQKRNQRKIYQKVLLTDSETAKDINCDAIKIQSENFKTSAVQSNIKLISDVPMHIAMRISVSDMFYVQPVLYQDNYYAGGAIDLMPIELACSMSNCVIMEKKKEYTSIEEALVRAVLGYSGNQRLADISQKNIEYWIDTSDVTQALQGHYCRKTINWSKLQIDITLPLSHRQFSEDMEMQWQYGYNKIKQQFTK